MLAETLDLLTTVPFWVAVLRIATPLILGTLGVLLCERAGVLNLGIEGIMVAGAFTGWLTVYQGGGLWLGVGRGGGDRRAARAAARFPHGVARAVAARDRAGHHALRVQPGELRLPRELPEGRQPADDPAVCRDDARCRSRCSTRRRRSRCSRCCSCPSIGYLLYRTPLGLAVRMVGENPAAAEGQGLSVARVRIGAIMAGSALMGVAGAFLTLAAFNAFYFNMVNGRGWVCVALVVFASWRPGKALLGALLFGLFDALQLRLQQSGSGLFGISVPYQVYLMLPYILSIVALVVMARRAAYPQALMKPYRKGER